MLYGLNTDVTGLDQLAYLSFSKITTILESERLFYKRYVQGEKKAPTSAMEKGQRVHEALLQPAQFKARYVVIPEFSGKGSREAKANYIASLPVGSIIIDEDEAKELGEMIDALHSHSLASELLSKGIPEVKALCPNPHIDGGLPLFVRPDFITNDGIVIDIKTASDVSYKGFQRSFYSNLYFVQNAFYKDGLNSIGHKTELCINIVVGTDAAHDVAVYTSDIGTLDAGSKLWKHGEKKINNFIARGKAPRIDVEARELALPSWAWGEIEQMLEEENG